MIDSSSSVGSTNFQKLEHFLKSVVSKLDVAPGKVQVGMVKYGSYPSVEFSLGAYKTRPEVKPFRFYFLIVPLCRAAITSFQWPVNYAVCAV